MATVGAIHPLGWYVSKMPPEQRVCRIRRHDWPTDHIEPGLRSLPDGIRVIGETSSMDPESSRLRIIEYCSSCGSEAVSFRQRNGHLDYAQTRRRITARGPDWLTIPREVESW